MLIVTATDTTGGNMGTRNRPHYEMDEETFAADAYSVDGYSGVAWHVLGWETEPTEETEWDGLEERTGRIIMRMIGDDTYFAHTPEEIRELAREDYCGECGQVGCTHDGLDRSEA